MLFRDASEVYPLPAGAPWRSPGLGEGNEVKRATTNTEASPAEESPVESMRSLLAAEYLITGYPFNWPLCQLGLLPAVVCMACRPFPERSFHCCTFCPLVAGVEPALLKVP